MILLEIFCDCLDSIKFFVKRNLTAFANTLNVILPYLMYWIGQKVRAENNNEIIIGGEVLIPILFGIIIYLLRSIANRINKGKMIPTPQKRFTTVDDDGEVSIENSRIQELLLYTADLEDWLEKKGLL